MGTRSVAQESSQKAPFLPIQSNNQPRLLTILSSIPPLKTVWRSGVYIPLPDQQQQYNQKRLQEASPPKSQRVPNFSIKSEKLEQLTKEREMTVGKTVPGTQLLLYSAAVLVVAPLLLWMLYLFWLVWMRLFWLVQFSLEFFFLLCFFHRCCSTTGEFLNGQYVSVLVANIVIH